MNPAAQRLAFAASSRLTEIFPVLGAHLLDASLRPLCGSRALGTMLARRPMASIRKVKAFARFLVIPDIHIGDAIMSQPALAAVRDFFPDAEIDYVVNRTAAPLIEGNPDATRVLPLFTGGDSQADVTALRQLIRDGRYDLCVCFKPDLDPEEAADPAQPFVSFMSRSPVLVRNESDPSAINHFSYQDYAFVRGLLSLVARPVRAERFRGARATFADDAIESARRFAADAGLVPGAPVLMFNPDTASPFTMMPFTSQVALLTRIARDTPGNATILLGEGHTAAGIGWRLAETLPAWLRVKVRLVPRRLPLAVYAALIDAADVFVSGDTGPLHLAAARRYARSGIYRFRNRTAVLSYFGATLPRMSGYDSSQRGYLPANQDAPSWCFTARSRCHNITCLNKLYKTCAEVRCFEHLDTGALARVAVAHLGAHAGPATASGPRPEHAGAGARGNGGTP
jgi:hypothetical protein